MPNGPLLIVDDEPQNLATMRQILRDDYPLLFARSGEDALRLAREESPSLILLDIQLPDLSGYEVCRQLKASPDTERAPVIFVTTLAEVGQEREGFDAGAVDYIVKPVSAPIVAARVRTHLSLVHATQLEKSYREAIFMLGQAGHYNDTDTGVHIWRMAAYAAALAREAGWSDERARLLELAAPMHDTGKIGIPDAILRKPGKLDADEWAVMMTHARIGFDILSRSEAPVFRLAAEVALRHHERWDGSGYPDGLAGEAIPESARIVAIADVFDALTSERPYKRAWSNQEAFSYLKEHSGTLFDSACVEVLLANKARIAEIQQANLAPSGFGF